MEENSRKKTRNETLTKKKIGWDLSLVLTNN